MYLYRAIDQFGQVIDVLVSEKRDLAATRRFFTGALEHGKHPSEVTTDWAPAYARVLDELMPAACHSWSNTSPCRSRSRSAQVQAQTDAWAETAPLGPGDQRWPCISQNLRGHYELGLDANPRHRLPAVFTELARAI